MYRPRSSPYGDVYTIPTTPIDNIANRLYREQQIREQQKLQQDKALDDEFAKNVAGVKSADIPEITSAYNDFKQAHINLQKKGQKATPQDQMYVMLKKAAAFQAINASKEDKERIKNRIIEVRADKKGLYNPNAHVLLSEMLNTPTSKRKLDEDDDKLKYKYAMPNIDKEIANAAGKGEEIELSVGVDEKDPLKDKFEVYKKINPPNTFYNNLFMGLASRSDNQGFTRTVMDSMTDAEKEKLRIAYEAKVQDPKFKAIYGEVQPFPASAANTELGQAVALKTMEAVVSLPIDKVKEKSVLNATRSGDLKFKQQKIMEGIKQANRKELFGMREAAKEAGEEANDFWVESYIDRLVSDAAAGNLKGYYQNKNGVRIKDDRIQIDPVLAKALTKDGVSPDQFAVQQDGLFRPIFYKRDKEGNVLKEKGNPVVDEIASVPMSKEQFKLVLGGKAGTKQLNKEMTKPGTKTKITVSKGELDDLK